MSWAWAEVALAAASPALAVAAAEAGERAARQWAKEGGEEIEPAPRTRLRTLAFAAIGAAIAFAALAAFEGDWRFIAAALGVAFVYSGVIDARVRLLPDGVTLAAAAAGLAQAGVEGAWLEALTGAAAAGGGLYLLRAIISRRAGREALGLGDVKLAAAGGLLLGPWAIWSALGAAAVATLAASGYGAWRRSESLEGVEIPFGPALLAAIWIGWALGAA